MTVTTKPRFDTSLLEDTQRVEPPKYIVILHNDDHHSMEEVVGILIIVMSFPPKKAVKHMLEAHKIGRSILTMTHFERAEHYTTQLKNCTLTATMEKA